MSGPALNTKIEVLQGVDFRESWVFFNPPTNGSKDPADLVPIDFSDCWARLQVKPSPDATATALISLEIGSGLEWASGTITPGPAAPAYNNGIDIWITRAISLAANSGVAISAYYDLLVDWPTGETSILARGTFNLVGTATRWTPGTAPTVTNIAPDNGPAAGGTTVTITGTNFASGATASIDGGTAVATTVLNPNSLTFVTVAHAAGGPYTLRILNPDGQFVDETFAFQYT